MSPGNSPPKTEIDPCVKIRHRERTGDADGTLGSSPKKHEGSSGATLAGGSPAFRRRVLWRKKRAEGSGRADCGWSSGADGRRDVAQLAESGCAECRGNNSAGGEGRPWKACR